MDRRSAFSTVLVAVVVLANAPVASGSPWTLRWTIPVLLQTAADLGMSYASDPAVAVNEGGDIFMAWTQGGGTYSQIWANHYVAGAGWTGPALLDPGHSDNADNPAVAGSASGAAVVAWQQRDGGSPAVFANYYSPQLGWLGDGAIAPLFATVGVEPTVAIDDGGVATVAWMQFDGVRYDVYASRYTPGSGWETVTRMETLTDEALFPGIAVDATGNVTVAFTQGAGSPHGVFANRFVVGTGWTGRVAVDTNASNDYQSVKLAANAQGAVAAVYVGFDGAQNGIYANRFTPSGGWGSGTKVSGPGAAGFDVTVSAGAGGGFEAGFLEEVTATYQPFAAATNAAGAWSRGTQLGFEDGSGRPPNIVAAPDGSAVATFPMAINASAFLMSATRSPAGAWGPAEAVDPDHANFYGSAMSGNSRGFAATLLIRFDGGYGHAYATTYTWVDHTPPTLSITSHADGTVTENATALVSGTVSSGATVLVNGVLAVGTAGSFQAAVALVPGNNTVTVVATDADGDRASLSIRLEYRNPVPVLEQQLAAAQADLLAAEARVASLESDATATQADLAAARAQANVTSSQLAAAQSNLSAQQMQLDGLRGALATSQAELTSTHALLNQTRAEAPATSSGGQVLLALALASVGIAVGGAAMVMGMRAGKRREPHPPEEATSKPNSDKKPPS